MSSEDLSSENLSSDKKSKCVGCGVETTNTLCERCFRIRNYNEYKKVDINYQEFLDNLDNIKKDDLVVLVVDLMNVPGSFNEINNKIIEVIIIVKLCVVIKLNMLKPIIQDLKFSFLNNLYRDTNPKNITTTAKTVITI